MLAPQEKKKLTFFLTSGLLQFTVTVLYLSFYYNILDVSVLTKFNKILLLFVTNKAVSGWSVSKEICHDEWIIPCNLLWRQAQSWSTPLFFDAINCISRYLQTNNWSGQPLANMQQSTCCVLPSQRCLQGNENAITFWVNKVITFCVKCCYILSCTIKFCFKNSYILHHYYILWRHSVSQRNVLWNVEKMQAAPWTLLLLVFLIKLSCRRSEFFII